MRVLGALILSCLMALAGSGGGPAVYTVGNIKDLSPGAEGILVLEENKAVFRSATAVIDIPYTEIQEAELGAKTMPPADVPLYKVWQLHKRLRSERVMRQMLNLELKDNAGQQRILTLEMEEPAAVDTLIQIEVHQGKRRRATNGDGWWGDSLWKTPRNKNTVGTEALGQSPVK